MGQYYRYTTARSEELRLLASAGSERTGRHVRPVARNFTPLIFICRAAGNRTQTLRSQSANTTTIRQPEIGYHSLVGLPGIGHKFRSANSRPCLTVALRHVPAFDPGRKQRRLLTHPLLCRAAGNRTRVSRTRIVYTTAVLQPETRTIEFSKHLVRVPGPCARTRNTLAFLSALRYISLIRGHGLVVEHVLAKDETGVRFSLAAPNKVIKIQPRRAVFLCGDIS